ncbi:PEP-CTERM sorting domain-containing protein [Agromyces larvae]|uniref:PEP-CTERM sorting domain-containing protein n=1 Tax=Agromyces larvae TaxID=2929802 RepID=A0ABY4BV82_9MICO|nr:PEP-CTERM sorting domain-containing protein [Agromyces larvae]UOE43118.1 PEP-CTERM sorting domain-containing protein [Agromyces larvae]
MLVTPIALAMLLAVAGAALLLRRRSQAGSRSEH